MNAPVTVAHPRFTDLFDPQLEIGLIAASAFVVVQRPVHRKRMARLADRDLPGRAHLINQQALASSVRAFVPAHPAAWPCPG